MKLFLVILKYYFFYLRFSQKNITHNFIKLLAIKTISSKFNNIETLYLQSINVIDRNFNGYDESEFKLLRRIFKEEYNKD